MSYIILENDSGNVLLEAGDKVLLELSSSINNFSLIYEADNQYGCIGFNRWNIGTVINFVTTK